MQETKQRDKSISLKDVKQLLGGFEARLVRTQVEGMSSCATPRPLFEFEIDIVDMGAGIEPPYYRHGLVGIDNFTKKASVVPLPGKHPSSLIEGAKDLIKYIGKPEQFYSDQEGAFNSAEWQRSMNGVDMKHVTSRMRGSYRGAIQSHTEEYVRH